MPDLPVGEVDYPDVRGMDQASAEAALSAVILGWTYGDGAYDALVARDKILTQSPDPSTHSTVDPQTTTVTLTVSLGEEPAISGALPDSVFGYRRLRRLTGSLRL